MQYMYIFGTDRKASLWRTVSDLFQQRAQILYLTCNVQMSKQFPNCLKLVETSVVPIAFTGNLCHVRVYTVPIFYHSLYVNQVPERDCIEQICIQPIDYDCSNKMSTGKLKHNYIVKPVLRGHL
jgi:hypothetical protein